MSRNELVNFARLLNIDPTTYVNDSKLEQKVLYEMRTRAAGAATYAAAPATASQTLSGGANV